MPANKSILFSVCQLGTSSVFFNVEMVLNDAITLNKLDATHLAASILAASIYPITAFTRIIPQTIEPVFASKLWASTKHHA